MNINFNRTILGVFAVLLCATPTMTTYADSLLTSGVSAKQIVYYQEYSTDDYTFNYTVANNEVTIAKVTKRVTLGTSGKSLTWGTYPNYVTGYTASKLSLNSDDATELVFPSEIDGMPVTTIGVGSDVLTNLDNVQYVEIPNSVTTINSRAFENLASIENFSIPDSITYVGINAFDGTAWFNSQPDGLLYIGRVAYRYLGSSTEPFEISLKDGTTQISVRCFRESSIQAIVIPNTVKSIDAMALAYCPNLESVTIPESVETVGDVAFLGNPNLKSITVLNPKAVVTYSGMGIYLTDGENGTRKAAAMEDVTIYGYTGSTAETYANKSGLQFSYLDTPVVTGDFNYDGSITSMDMLLLKAKLLGIYKNINCGDLNLDGNVDVIDLMALKSQIINDNESEVI